MAKLKVRPFKCVKCDRTFSMAAHLARHRNTMHAAKKKKTAKKRRAKHAVRKMRRRVGGPAKRVRQVAAGGAAPLLRQMHAYRNTLLAERAHVASQIDAIDQALAAVGAATRAPVGRPARGRGGAGPRRGSLKFYIDRVLRSFGGAMAVKDVTVAVRKAGFRSKNKTLAKSVGIAMSQMPNVAKVSRGTFRLK
ncbi:MAG: C2H2-type zinc finger protein [Phycisphaerae bacterium]